MASVTFSTGFHVIKPGLRVSGDEISVVFKGMYDSGIYAGKKYIHIDLTNEPDLSFVEAGVAGPLDTVADVDALYTQLLDAGMTEAFDGFLVDPSDLSSIKIDNQQISFDFAGHSPYVFGRNSDAEATERVKVANQTWTLPQPDFASAVTLFTDMESPEELEFRSIEERFTAEDAQLDALIASGMWLFATQADFPPAADNHGRVVHSHADGAIFFAHAGAWHQVANEADLQTVIASLASEADIREGADSALSARLDTLESDPTTATAVAAGDAATLSSANAYADTKVSDLLDGAGPALDTLKELGDALQDNDDDIAALVTAVGNAQSTADTNTIGLATEVTDRQSGDAALSGRLDVLEADPTTATDVTTGDASTLSSANSYTDTEIATEASARTSADASLSGRLDVLEADPTTQTLLNAETTARTIADGALGSRITTLEGNAAITDPTTATAVAAVQSDVDANQTSSESADGALSGRLDVLEADPTTQALLDAETTAREEGDLNAIGQSNAYTDGLLNQYFSGAATEEKADAYNAVIQAGFTPIIDAIGSQIKFNDADVASVTAIAINHDSSAGRIDWFEVFPTGSVFRVTRASDSAVFDFTVTQAGTGGANSRTKNFTVTTSSTGTLVDGDVLAISTVGGPDVATSGDLDVAGKLAVAGTEESTIAGDLKLANGYTTGKLECYEVRGSIFSRFGGVQSNGTLEPDSRIDVSSTSSLLLQTDNTDYPGTDNEYVTVELKKGYLKPLKNKDGAIFMDLGTSAEPWKDLYLSGNVDIGTDARVEFADNLTKIHNLLRGTSINIGNNIELKPAAAGGRVEITGDLIIDASDFVDAANDTAAAAAGVVVGQVYRNGSDLKVRIS